MKTRRGLISLAIALTSAGTASAGLSGRVLSAAGEPLGGVTVTAYALETADEQAARLVAGAARPPVARTRSDARGVFRLDPVPAVVDVEVRASGFAPAFGTVADAEPVTFALRPAPTVRGVVLAKGRPIVDATVVWTTDPAVAQSHGLEVRTGADGTYEIPDPGEWAGGLMVSHPDFALLTASPGPLEFRPRPSLRHELEPGVALAGRVVEEGSGRPVAGATIVVGGWPRARSSRDGSFVVRHAGRGWERLVALAPGLVGDAGPTGGPIVVPLRPARRLAGTVRDAKTGTGLAGAVVTLHDERKPGMATAVTDARGRFVFAHLSAARYRAWVTRPGYTGARPHAPESVPIDLRREASAAHDFRLSALQPLRGRVQDVHGQPIDGALVVAWAKDAPTIYIRSGGGRTTWPVAWTELDGRFALAPQDEWARELEPAVLVLKRGYAAGRWEPDGAGAGPPVITLTRGVELAGRVTDQDGEPISGVSVTLVEEGQLGTFPFLERAPGDGWMTSDARGLFLTRVHDVGHHLAFRKSGRLPEIVRGHHPSSNPPLDVTLEPAAEIRGRILRSDGSGVPDVQVFVMGDSPMGPAFATTASDGAFVIQDLSPGPYELHFSKGGTGLAGSRTANAPDADLRIEMEPSGTIQGWVSDAWTRAPIERFSVELAPVSASGAGGQRTHYAPSVEGAGGAFTIEEVPVGETTLTVHAEGYVAGRVEGVAITSEGDGPALEISLDRGARIQGFVTDEGGAPLADVRVSAEGVDRETPSVVTDTRGAYDLRGVAPGEVKLKFEKQKYITARQTVEAADTTRVDAPLALGLVVRGVVLADGVGVPGARLWARSSSVNADRAWAETDERGRFALEGLAPGRYAIEARGPEGGETQVEDVDVERAGVLRLSIEQPETAVLSGWVTGLPDPDDVRTIQVWARGQDGSEFASVDGSGWFQMEKAPTGRVTIQADATFFEGGERSTRKQELSLAPGSETETILEFVDGLVVTGYVTREGMPVAHMRVSFEAADGSGVKATGRTDREGLYEVVGLEPGPYRVSAWGNGISRSMEHTVAGHEQLDIDVTGAALLGVVVDAAGGSPLAEVSVSLWRRGPGENTPDESMTSNAQGVFEVRSLEEGQYRLLASKQGFGQELRELTLGRGDTAEVEIALEPSEGLTLEVVDARDRRPLNATVVVRDTARRIVANRHSGVGPDGTLTIPLAPGQYLLSTSATGYGTVTRPVTVPGSGLRVGLTPGGTLVLESEHALDGRIRLVDEAGEEYVRCWCNGFADIDLEGRRTTVENVTPGTYTLEVIAWDGVPRAPLTVAIGEGQISRVSIQ